ncbi:hypothetical protein [Chloroflexus sp.]|nr:hypothetical protein [uncultured Chloroflexus sp.]
MHELRSEQEQTRQLQRFAASSPEIRHRLASYARPYAVVAKAGLRAYR